MSGEVTLATVVSAMMDSIPVLSRVALELNAFPPFGQIRQQPACKIKKPIAPLRMSHATPKRPLIPMTCHRFRIHLRHRAVPLEPLDEARQRQESHHNKRQSQHQIPPYRTRPDRINPHLILRERMERRQLKEPMEAADRAEALEPMEFDRRAALELKARQQAKLLFW